MTKQILAKLFALLFISIILTNAVISRSVQALDSPVLITEVLTGYTDFDGAEYPKFEYIEIANISDQPVNLSGWRLEYLSAANNGSTPGLVIDTLSSQISAGGQGLWVHADYWPVDFDGLFGTNDTSSSGLLAKTGGHVRLMNGVTMMDCVAWGSASVIAGCDKINSLPPASHSLQRQSTNGSYSKASGVLNLPVSPRGGGISAIPNEPPTGGELGPQKECTSIVISEILANPAGEDANNEYIEIYNPALTQQSLYGCILKAASGKSYEFPSDAFLAAGEYRALYFGTTGIQLTNSGSDIVLVTITTEATVSYPAAGDDEAWAYINNSWQTTKQPTPNGENNLQSVAPGGTVAETASESAPCPAGKYRNLETNRCRNIIENAQAPTACAPDQERNSETGRCRKKAATTVATTCPTGQERNPSTNRCRKVGTASTTTKACEAGQERNPDTGRCRKVTKAKPTAVLGATTKKTYHLALIVVMMLALLGYGIYEYRNDMRNTLLRLKRRFAKN